MEGPFWACSACLLAGLGEQRAQFGLDGADGVDAGQHQLLGPAQIVVSLDALELRAAIRRELGVVLVAANSVAQMFLDFFKGRSKPIFSALARALPIAIGLANYYWPLISNP